MRYPAANRDILQLAQRPNRHPNRPLRPLLPGPADTYLLIPDIFRTFVVFQLLIRIRGGSFFLVQATSYLALPLGELSPKVTERAVAIRKGPVRPVCALGTSPIERSKGAVPALPAGEPGWVRFVLLHSFGDISPFLIRLAWRRAAFTRGIWCDGIVGMCCKKRTWSAGACPRPTKGISFLSKLLSCNEPGAPRVGGTLPR